MGDTSQRKRIARSMELRMRMMAAALDYAHKMTERHGARYVRRLELIFKSLDGSASFAEFDELDALLKEDAGKDARCPDCDIRSGRNHTHCIHHHDCTLIREAVGDFCVVPQQQFIEGNRTW